MSRRILPPSVLVCLLFNQYTPVSAQQLAALQMNEADFFSDLPVVLTATRLKQPQKDAPIATTIIDRQMIEASGFTEIADLLRLAPGMLVNYDSGHIPAVGYQFLYNRYTVRMQVLVDGKSVYTPIFGEMPWTQLGITVDDIERIEVIRGPSSSSYGPNAMTGVISIITRHASLDNGMRVKVNRGNNSLSEQFVTYGNSVGRMDYKVTMAARKDDGFAQRYDGKELSLANFRGDYQPTNKDFLTFHLGYSSGEYQEDNVYDPNLHPNHVKKVLETSQQVKWVHTLNNNDEITVNYYQQKHHDRNNYDGNYLGTPVFMDETVRTDRSNLDFMHSIYRGKYSFSWGITLREDTTSSPQYFYGLGDIKINTRQLFINSEIILNESNTLNMGLMADNNDTADTSYSPRVSLNHHLDSHNTIRLSYAEATRSPFAFDEYTNYYVPDLGVPIWTDLNDLEHEKIKSFDLGYVGLLNENNTEVDLRIYKNELSNLISLDWDIGGGFYNGDAFNITGFESSITHKTGDSRLRLNYSYTRIDAKKADYLNASAYETGAPQDNLSLLAMHNFSDNFSASLGYYYTGEMQQLGSEDIQPARKRIDIRFVNKFKLAHKNASIALVIHNLTNEKVETDLLNNVDRNGYLSFKLEM